MWRRLQRPVHQLLRGPARSAFGARRARGLCEGQVPGTGARGAALHMVFTCARCGTRAAKAFTKHAYEHGVVVVTCPGCQGRHVIADNLGWFGEEKNVEEILRAKGEAVVRVSDCDLDLGPGGLVEGLPDGDDVEQRPGGVSDDASPKSGS